MSDAPLYNIKKSFSGSDQEKNFPPDSELIWFLYAAAVQQTCLSLTMLSVGWMSHIKVVTTQA